MYNYQLLKVSKRVAIVLLIAVFSVAGIVACSNDVTVPSQSIPSTNETEIVTPEEPEEPTFPENTYEKIAVSWGRSGSKVIGYEVSYLDTNSLKEIWLEQIMRKRANDGKVFVIRNRANNRDMNNFQKPHNGRQDYYYFAENGDIYYKGGDKNNKTGETLIKKFVGAVIIQSREVTSREAYSPTHADDVIQLRTDLRTIGGVYRMAISESDAQKKFAHWTEPTDGAYEFIAARRRIYTFYTLTVQESYWFKREFDTSSLEVLVLNPWANERYNENCLGVDAYYEYYSEPGHTMKFTESILGTEAASPDNLDKILSRTTTFTDASRWWSFLAMPGNPN